jgi:poly(3-hydroxybutyrate) depolymerase
MYQANSCRNRPKGTWSAIPSMTPWVALPLWLLLSASTQHVLAQNTRVVAWGTRLDPQAQTLESRALAKTLALPQSPQWRAKGDQKRSYRFAAANADLPYRVCVPAAWNGADALPLVMFLHGAGNNESSYLDQNNKLMVKLADEHGAILVSPLGHQSAYGAFIRLPAVFDEQAEADKMLAQITDQTERANELSEKDVINVLELVLNEYPVDSTRIFLTGHSMGSGGTWYLGGKYSYYWRALAPMSGPFVLKKGYPWETILKIPVFVTEGTNTSSTESSRRMRDWMREQKGRIAFKEVAADHAGMVPLVLPDVFAFFDSVSALPVSLDPSVRAKRSPTPFESRFTYGGIRMYRGPERSGDGRWYFDLRGRTAFTGLAPTEMTPGAENDFE